MYKNSAIHNIILMLADNVCLFPFSSHLSCQILPPAEKWASQGVLLSVQFVDRSSESRGIFFWTFSIRGSAKPSQGEFLSQVLRNSRPQLSYRPTLWQHCDIPTLWQHCDSFEKQLPSTFLQTNIVSVVKLNLSTWCENSSLTRHSSHVELDGWDNLIK